jgi:hypothetical protein
MASSRLLLRQRGADSLQLGLTRARLHRCGQRRDGRGETEGRELGHTLVQQRDHDRGASEVARLWPAIVGAGLSFFVAAAVRGPVELVLHGFLCAVRQLGALRPLAALTVAASVEAIELCARKQTSSPKASRVAAGIYCIASDTREYCAATDTPQDDRPPYVHARGGVAYRSLRFQTGCTCHCIGGSL